MTDTPERTNVFYDAIDAFQRTHRLPGLQHAQLRGLLAEHLARVVPAAPAVVEPPADRAARRDLIEEYLRFLRGQGPEPDLSGLSAERCEEIAGQFKIVKALADRDPDLPPLDIDPVARRLGLHEQPAAVPPPAVVDPTADRIAEAALGAVEAALGDTLVPAARVEALAGIAAVLPAPADRAQERIWSEDGFTGLRAAPVELA